MNPDEHANYDISFLMRSVQSLTAASVKLAGDIVSKMDELVLATLLAAIPRPAVYVPGVGRFDAAAAVPAAAAEQLDLFNVR